MRVGNWAKLLSGIVAGRQVVREDELLEALVNAGRAIGPDWKGVLAHNMRSIRWKLRRRSRTYIPKSPVAVEQGA